MTTDKICLDVWGRKFELKVIYDVYENEEILEIQRNAFDMFIENASKILKDDSFIKKYCQDNSNNQITGDIDNIFKYVIPNSLYIMRDGKKRKVVLLCDYRYDEEHGIAIGFENERISYIGSQIN